VQRTPRHTVTGEGYGDTGTGTRSQIRNSATGKKAIAILQQCRRG
jgi:hypothetical protein